MRDSSCTAHGFLLWRVVDAEMELCSVIALCPTDSSCIGSCSFAEGEVVKMTSVKHIEKQSEPIE